MGMRVLQLMTLVTVVVTCVATPSGLGQECGDNPMKEILNVAKRTGRWSARRAAKPVFVYQNRHFRT